MEFLSVILYLIFQAKVLVGENKVVFCISSAVQNLSQRRCSVNAGWLVIQFGAYSGSWLLDFYHHRKLHLGLHEC